MTIERLTTRDFMVFPVLNSAQVKAALDLNYRRTVWFQKNRVCCAGIAFFSAICVRSSTLDRDSEARDISVILQSFRRPAWVGGMLQGNRGGDHIMRHVIGA